MITVRWKRVWSRRMSRAYIWKASTVSVPRTNWYATRRRKTKYGQFMNFENITYAPIDLDAIDPDEMTGREKKMLNDYHAMVYKTLSPYMTPEENEWLKKYTRAI